MMDAWHFVQADRKTRFEPRKLIVVGEALKVDEEKLKLCKYGLHASIKPLDALNYCDWEKPIICRVKLSGKILESDDKMCASERTVIWMADADKILHEFACWCAEQSLHLFENKFPDDKRPRLAIAAKKRWLRGEITDEELAAAAEAAWNAERAARDAAWTAAWATRYAAYAAGAAAWATGYAERAAWAAQAAGDATAWSAAWYAAVAAWEAAEAAGDAARDEQNRKLESMFLDLKPESEEG